MANAVSEFNHEMLNQFESKQTKVTEVKPGSIWQLVKRLEESNEDLKGKQYGELYATLVVNFSEQSKQKYAGICSTKDTPMCMLIQCFEYFIKRMEKAESELEQLKTKE